ncbi:complex I assembly factor TIMMDC1, mitochondrial isoform X2 [Eublepharis macularius]|uniref:Complex I assembly factor TIMMDC1, mitochondrial n=1 Tax=Eublepharis macularius TaxID=481883 RepID=A0AA97J1Y2_EUBMA|nr:complex I assembly factor TIMMDC1, mitochondrial isoform X2 [Eublepharis macularius]
MEPPPGPAASSAVFGGQPGSKPWFAGRPQPPESGWERILELFRKDELNRYPEETVSICKATFTAGVVGFVYGGIPGFVYAKERYIEQSGAEMYHSRLDAAQSAHRAAVRGFIRYGWRWSWRIAAFVAIFKVPAGGLMMAMQNLSGETLHEGRKQERRERYEQQLIEWNNSLGITEKISKEIDDYIQEGAEKRHDEKIQK